MTARHAAKRRDLRAKAGDVCPAGIRFTMSQGGYDPGFYRRLADVEDRHFWFRARDGVLDSVFRRLSARRGRPLRVLDVGCGTGHALRLLGRACPGGTIVGVDLHREGLAWARRRAPARLVQGDLRRLPFRVPFDVVALLDVIEHVPEDEALLRRLRGLLADGGSLVVTVPAYGALWSYFDEAARHCRRYEPAALRRTLEAAGFRVERCTPFLALLFPLAWGVRRLSARGRGVDAAEQHRLADDELRIRPGLNGLLAAWLGIERRWLDRRDLPFGTSLLAVATRGTRGK